MSPLHPTEPLQQLTGAGINVRACVPGYPTTAPDGRRRWILGHGDDELVITEDHAHGVFIVEASDLPAPVTILEEEVRDTVAGVRNLFATRVWYARRALAMSRGDDPVWQRIIAMAEASIRTAVPA